MMTRIQLAPSDTFTSFDVEAMFPSISPLLVIQIIKNRRQDKNIFAPSDKDTFPKMVEFCIPNSYRQYDGKFHKQKNGLAMGSPLSPILAELIIWTTCLKSWTKILTIRLKI